jgi:hypothetical protein
MSVLMDLLFKEYLKVKLAEMKALPAAPPSNCTLRDELLQARFVRRIGIVPAMPMRSERATRPWPVAKVRSSASCGPATPIKKKDPAGPGGVRGLEGLRYPGAWGSQ